MTRWKQEEAQGQPLREVFNAVNEQTRQTVENPALRAMRESAIVGLANHTVLIAKDGTETSIDDIGAPIKGSEGGIIGAVLIFRDITKRKLVEQERSKLLDSERAAREKAEAASRLKDEFVAMISH
jgi:PAS domain S-box-containing protein